MSLSHKTMLDLMAYADGEADPEVAARIEKLLEVSAEARGVVAAMAGPVAAVGAFVAREADARATRAGADTIANAVMDKIAPADVSSLDAARAKRDARGRTALAIGAIVAIAAGVLIYARNAGDPTPGDSPMASMAPSESVPLMASSPVEPPEGVVANAEPPEVTIKSTTSHDVSVLVVPAVEAAANANGSPASVIVWIGDNPGGKN
jgi:hypothetical protein